MSNAKESVRPSLSHSHQRSPPFFLDSLSPPLVTALPRSPPLDPNNLTSLHRASTGCLPSSSLPPQVVASLNELASAFGTLKSAHSKAQSAIKAYASALNDSDEPQALLSQFPALFNLGSGDIKAVRRPSPLSAQLSSLRRRPEID